jgi:ribosomal protein S18 acetylase RimI-like enzyme
MKFIATTPEALELKYYQNSNYEYSLVWNYIGPQNTHGDSYYQSKFKWFEVFNDITSKKNPGIPLAIFCIVENMHISFSLHLSVFEVLHKNQGHGTIIMNELIKNAKFFGYKYFTVYPLNEGAKEFYLKVGLTEHKINDLILMGTVL